MYQKTFDEENVTVISLIMFYDHMNTSMFRVLIYIIYTILDSSICLDYPCFIQYKLSKYDFFFNTRFDDLSGIGIPVVFMNLTSYHGFKKEQHSTVILTWHSEKFSYYISKGFVIVETKEDGLENMPSNMKEKINT